MKHSVLHSALITAALLVSAHPSLALEGKSSTAGEAKAISSPKATGPKAQGAKPAAKPKLVDINSASKKELMTLPRIGEAEADKIIAGRPYLVKAHLVTHNVVSRAAYENLKALVIAKPKQDPVARSSQK